MGPIGMQSGALWAVALTLAALSVPAGAEPKAAKPAKECPYALSDFEKIEDGIEKAPTCSAALELFSACALGASGDVSTGGKVRERCEQDFLGKLGKSRKQAYAAEHKRCERKYARMDGTMYRSAEAFCHAELAEKYARRHVKAAPR